jgi:hypothetical protein
VTASGWLAAPRSCSEVNSVSGIAAVRSLIQKAEELDHQSSEKVQNRYG